MVSSTELATVEPAGEPLLVAVAEARPEVNPAAVYLARLASGSRRTIRGALERIAALVSGGQLPAAALAWHELRYQHTQAVRAALSNSS